MGEPRPPEPVIPFTGLLLSAPSLAKPVGTALRAKLGPALLETEPYRWTFSTYYAGEMGPNLWRSYLFFRERIDPAALGSLKIWSNELEVSFGTSTGGRLQRRVNIDPGYVDPGKVVLASTKSQGHRIYLGGGVYAEVSLLFRSGDYRPLDYTYPDLQSEEARAMFHRVRTMILGGMSNDSVVD
jgi:hypothetical protein